MALQPLPITDTRFSFRPLTREFLELLRSLDHEQFERPTVAGAWRVRDVLAHLIDSALRRVSFHRDGHTPPPPPTPLTGEGQFVRFINGLNAEWVAAMRRVSPSVLVELFDLASARLADFIESLPPDAPPLFPVSWAGEDGNHGWLDIGREFTEQWHHQQPIRDAVGARPASDARWLHAVLAVALRGLPHAYRDTPAVTGTTIAFEIGGEAGGLWTLRRDADRWTLWGGAPDSGESARIVMSDDTAWRLLFNALPAQRTGDVVRAHGDPALVGALLAARSVIV
jgi:uncharacterized protein (TIGR03083 family)